MAFLFPLALCLLQQCPAFAAPFEEIIQTNRPGQIAVAKGEVQYLHGAQSPALAQIGQGLDFGDALRTLNLAHAVVRLDNWSWVKVRDRSRLEIQRQPDETNAPAITLRNGQAFFSSRGGRRTIPTKTPQLAGVPKGTEFLVSVDEQAGRTVFTMFDGEVDLSDGQTSVTIRSGEQAIAVTGQGIIRGPLEAANIVQWWIYYPGILDPAELGLSPDEQVELVASLAAYRTGDLQTALQQLPRYPTPPDPDTDAKRLYHAGLFLAVGAVDRAEAQLSKVNPSAPLARALRTMIAAVAPPFVVPALAGKAPNGSRRVSSLSTPPPKGGTTSTASELLALSYAHQATNNLKAALASALAAVARSTNFGFGWARVAELEFSFGHTRAAHEAVAKALDFTPRNAQAHALNGFLFAAENHVRDALAAFNQAIDLDPALGNAWLGRGLCKRRLGWFQAPNSHSALRTPHSALDWLSDLQTAAALEPRRSLLRSYAGKAFSEVGDARLASKELNYAKKLDENDPTPWLYSALEKWQENRVNEAVRDLDRSIELYDNRAVYRSRLMLDQDRAVRSASLAKIYRDAGLNEVALREAARAVSYDYANHAAHQFLAESYDALRDPTRFNLRHETAWFNELLLANILSPVGAGLLSQNISQQEYSPLFERNRLGLLSSTEYRSDGQFRQLATQSGAFGRTAWALDLDYQHNDGVRPNNDLDRVEIAPQFKQQLSARDTLYVRADFLEYRSGDNFQHYEPTNASRNLRLNESQVPAVLGALHREWSPGLHTTLLGGRFVSDQTARGSAFVLDLRTNGLGQVDRVLQRLFRELDYHSHYEAWVGEFNQIVQSERSLLIGGGRFQSGQFAVTDVLDGVSSLTWSNLVAPPVRSQIDESFQRLSLYGYGTHEIWPRFRLTAGVAYDHLRFPRNFRFSPVTAGQARAERISPKAALHWDVSPRLTLRGMYAQTLGGVSYDESVRLEPVQLAGFSQAFRSVISEAEAGSVAAPVHELGGAALDLKLPSRTFLGLEARFLASRTDQVLGVFYNTGLAAPPRQAFPAGTPERLDYEERAVSVSAGQLLGEQWSVGAAYTYAESRLDWFYPEIPTGLQRHPARTEQAQLHHPSLMLTWNHPNGLFARAEAHWYLQSNGGYTPARPGDNLNQVNLFVGWRFARRRGEIALGCLNLGGADYRLNSLTPYPDLPRERVWMARFRLNF